ncbi:ThiJ/PfpI [Cristinia sonorae]|uniref:D-lactate dehydratase n=1 Tax=Cristinia sonorae TaxID=1940300 RepID=A0A8K0UDV7_9AGAR|nr:ThiJ/PfpI [Cristinia sonorae]
MAPKVLFVLTSADKNLRGEQTGWYLPEAAHPYYVLEPHAEIDFAAPKGPNPPVDEGSVKSFTDPHSVKFLNDPSVTSKLATTKKLSDVSAADYDAVFYVGGHGPFYRAGKVTAAVCHGPAALIKATTTDGKSIFAGNEATGFSNAEETTIKMAVPFLHEDKTKELGGSCVKENEQWGPDVVVSGHLITGEL